MSNTLVNPITRLSMLLIEISRKSLKNKTENEKEKKAPKLKSMY